MSKRLSTNQFIEKAKEIHGDKYDYSKVEYVKWNEKVCIICPIHGEFWQIPNDHLQGKGCKQCGYEKILIKQKITIEQFIERAKLTHGNKYDYSKVEYINARTNVCIICPIHGEFWQSPYNHLKGRGCQKCGYDLIKNKLTNTLNHFIEKSKEIHGDKYDYSKVEYVNNCKKVCIICPIHGEFWQSPKSHLNGRGCQKCGEIKREKSKWLTTEKFIEKAKKIHGNKYDYSKVKYIDSKTKVCIICSKHGEFWMTPSNHLNYQGCKKCKNSIMENKIVNILNENNIQFEQQKRFEWLGRQSLDFYIPEYNIAIECQGEQHFKSVDYWGGENAYNKRKKLDLKKKNLCKINNINLYYVLYNENLNEKIQEILFS